ncbi:DUF5610 domain-containing protein [Reinekea marina]|uniref:DUF5610 domain-containing protein n=1 Tax=Reinekea marina TaxID=1310421 RepID=A0ABV7WMK6_9GAMM|nr:DUF5610 domain-containing protein [Reinekea marina]MDN3649385.1 DUF5610 domain-containing protein [Reinekea marina]
MHHPISGYSGTTVNYDRPNRDQRAEAANRMLDKNPISVNQAQEAETVEAPSKAINFDVDALVDQIWGFAQQRISDAKANGASEDQIESMFEAAEQGVKQGFGEAKEILDELGQLDEPLTMKIDSAFGQIMDRLDEQDLSVPSNRSEPIQAPIQRSSASSNVDRQINMYQYERQTFSLNLTTNEGDKIMIRSVAESSSTLEDKRFGRESSTVWGSQQSSGFQLMIKGDLNEQEAADLDALLAQVNEVANEFYEGDYQKAFDMATELNIDGSSMRSMDLNMKEVEAKGVGVYAEVAEQPAKIPAGLSPLKEYAEKLLASQEQWFEQFNSRDAFLTVIENHPMNRGELFDTLSSLLS